MNVVPEVRSRDAAVARRQHAAQNGWSRGFENLPREHGFEPLRVEGALPADLLGTFYWNGPGMLAAFGGPYGHWFDGDGAVGAVRFGPGGASGAVRLVATPSLDEERRANKRLYSRLLTRSPRPFAEHLRGRRRNPCNVNVLAQDGRLFALGIGRPIEISAEDLSTIGELDPNDVALRAFCAHPHYSRGRRAFYGFSSLLGRRSALEVYELPDRGPRRRLVSVTLDAPTLVHDCYVTERHVLIVVPPLRFRPLPLLLNLRPAWKCLEWRGAEGTEILVVPIDAPERVARITVPSFFMFHIANAYEQGDRIVADMPCSDDFSRTGPWLAALASGGGVDPGPDSRMRRLTIDLARGRADLQRLDDTIVEMPRVSPRVEGEPHRFVFQLALRDGECGAPDLLHKLDTVTGRSIVLSLGPATHPAEPVVVPRSGGRAEDDAYVLTLVYDARTHTSHVAVLDARAPENGPLARVHFDHHVPFPFHGTWVPWTGATA